MRSLFKVLLYVLILIAALAACVVVYAVLRWDRTFDDHPMPALRASDDPEVVARGAYLVYGPAACAACHVAPEDQGALEAGARPPLAGGRCVRLGVAGQACAPNLTPHPTGIGALSDGQLARAIRGGVHHTGRALYPLMAYQHISDDDLRAILSHLRAAPPVDRPSAPPSFTLSGKLTLALAVDLDAAPTPATPPPSGADPVYGAYLANEVAMCGACHTPREAPGLPPTGPLFSGGQRLPHVADPARVLLTPNLTPDLDSGVMATWSEDDFVRRFRDPDPAPGSLMPWATYARMSDADLRALYRYLSGLEPRYNPDLVPDAAAPEAGAP